MEPKGINHLQDVPKHFRCMRALGNTIRCGQFNPRGILTAFVITEAGKTPLAVNLRSSMKEGCPWQSVVSMLPAAKYSEIHFAFGRRGEVYMYLRVFLHHSWSFPQPLIASEMSPHWDREKHWFPGTVEVVLVYEIQSKGWIPIVFGASIVF